MVRSILSVIAGYGVMFLLVFVAFTCLYLAVGANGAFEPGTYNVGLLWIAASTVLGTAAAIAGGWVCAHIARRPMPARVLAGIVVALGMVLAGLSVAAPAANPAPRAADVPNLEAMTKARLPHWLEFASPILSAAGVLVGARLKK